MVEVQLLQKLCIRNIIKNWSYFIGTENFTLPEQYLLDFLECCVENNEISMIHQVLLSPHVSDWLYYVLLCFPLALQYIKLSLCSILDLNNLNALSFITCDIIQKMLFFQLLLDLVETKDFDVTLYTSTRLLVDNNIPIHNEISKIFVEDAAYKKKLGFQKILFYLILSASTVNP